MRRTVVVAVYREGEVQKALLKLGIDCSEVRNELQGHCPLHKERTGREDINPSWSMNQETGVHHCFSCGYRGTLLSLVAELKEFKTSFGLLDFEAAKGWLTSHVDVDLAQLVRQMEDAKNSYVRLRQPVAMGEARLAVFTDPIDSALSARGLTLEACKTYSVKWDNKKSIWIIPIRNADTGGLMGWQEKGQGHKHFFNRPPGIQKSKTLFGITEWAGPTMVVVESPLDAVKVGVCRNSTEGVALCGVTVSAAQIDIMKRADKLILAFDNPNVDSAGKAALEAFVAVARSNGIEFWAFNYGDSTAKDIGEMTPDEVVFGIEHATHCVMLRGSLNVKSRN